MTDFKRNNLDKAKSPYLKQHKDNPIHWQEWNQETLDFAKKNGKPILVSVGYSTCHWCHVMAGEAFSDEDVADTLNESFVSIKVDREQRPDLDQYFMDFATRTVGSGGWPLNVILSPDAHPFFAGTYFPVDPKHGLPGFQDVLRQVLAWYEEHKEDVGEYQMLMPESGEVEEEKLLSDILDSFDEEWGGIGHATKFPPYNTLLFLMSNYEANPDEKMRSIITQTLDFMAQRGLHDHLQGGFFRYCVDREWTIPHFEKMLYDQGMHLWVYSVAYKLFGNEAYKQVATKLIQCLKETFEDDGLFYAGHDADTNHEEGATYVWSSDELKGLEELYEVSDEGNFEGKNHLVKKKEGTLPKLEAKLLKARKKRPQPFVDKKFVTSWNALVGIGLVMASRHADQEDALGMAHTLFESLLKKHYVKGHLAHSSLDGDRQDEEFLEDYAGLLLLATYLYEEDFEGKELIAELLEKLQAFYQDGWLMNPGVDDFTNIPAPSFDHPVPSPVSLAEYARYRAREILEQKEAGETDPTYVPALQSDFHNLFVFLKIGNDHVLHVPEKIDWKDLPLNAMQFHGTLYLDCYKKMCKMHPTREELLKSFD